jgi:hypothetical protein
MAKQVLDDQIDAFMAVRDLIDAAGHAALLARLLEDPTAT